MGRRSHDPFRTHSKDRALVGIGAVLVVLAVVAVAIWGFAAQEKWDTWCMGQGGRVDTSTSHGYGWTTVNGKSTYGPVTTTTRYCLTDDGRIIDIY